MIGGKTALLVLSLMWQNSFLISQATQKTSTCDPVAIDSIPEIGMRHDKILGFSRARGLSGPIDWVGIVPPQKFPQKLKIRRMIVWQDTKTARQPICHIGPDISMQNGINCRQGLPQTPVQLSISFELDTDNPEFLTRELVKYVITDVLCILH